MLYGSFEYSARGVGAGAYVRMPALIDIHWSIPRCPGTALGDNMNSALRISYGVPYSV